MKFPRKKVTISFEAKLPKAYDEADNEITNEVPLWPALWILGNGIYKNGDDNIPWRNCGEIDIMEWTPSNQGYSNAIHYPETYRDHRFTGAIDLTDNYNYYTTIIKYFIDKPVEIEMKL